MCAAKFGSIPEFNQDSDWEIYLDRIEQFFAANDISNQDQQRAIFLTCCGDYLYGLLSSIISPKKPKELGISEIFEKIGAHIQPKPSPIVSRCTFNKLVRNSNESVSEFSNRLRKLSVFCNYGQFLDDMLRDRFICGINDSRIQRRLFAEESGLSLTFQKAFDIALSIETANRNVDTISNKPAKDVALTESHKPVHHTVTTDKTKPLQQKSTRMSFNKSRDKPSPNNFSHGNCSGCGGQHPRAKCKFKNAICHNCHLKGHLAAVCRSKEREKSNKNNQRLSTIHSEDQSQEIVINSLRFHEEKPFTQELLVNGKKVVFEVDTGSPKTIINQDTLVFIGAQKQLQKSSIVLRTYTRQIIPVLGEVQVNVTYQHESKMLTLMTVKDNVSTNLLGRDWLKHFPHILDRQLPVNHQTEDPKLINNFPSLFTDDNLGSDITVTIQVKPEAVPKYCKARQVPLALRQKVEDEIYRLQRQGIIEPIRSSNWATPVVPVIKPDGTVRLCGDYKVTLNPNINIDKYPMPRLEEIRAKLAGSKILSKLDLSHAYLQLQVDPESQELTTINTHLGLFKYRRLPFGIASAPAIFQREIDAITKNIPNVAAVLDDIIIGGTTSQDHDEKLTQVLQRLQQHNLKLNKEKCIFRTDKLKYLGYEFIGDSIAPTEDKYQAIQAVPEPTNLTQLRSFLGLINYYGHFIPNLSSSLRPLYRLLGKDVLWQWGKAERMAFNEAKKKLLSDQVLIAFNPNLPLYVVCDASNYGIGAVLEHEVQGERRPIWFASRILTPSEKNYSQIEKEALAIIFAVKKIHFYVYGRKFNIETDHKPLTTLFGENKATPELASPRIIRWRILLNAYNFSISFKSGVANSNADALSRLPHDTPTEPEVKIHMLSESAEFVRANEIKQWTRRDPLLSLVKNYLKFGWPNEISEELKPYYHRRNELSVIWECVHWGSRVIIPTFGRDKVLNLLHHEHPGIVRMKALARGSVWWPNIDKSIEETVKRCQECQLNANTRPKVPIEPRTWPSIPWKQLYMDITHFKEQSFLVLVDACSKWLEVIELRQQTSEVIIRELRRLFATFGIPESITSDNSSIFTSDEFRQFLSNNAVRQTTTPPYHPASNDMAERAGETFKASFRKSHGPTDLRLARFLFHYRNTPHSSTGETPANLMFRHSPRSILDILKPSSIAQQSQARGKEWADRHSRDRYFHVGDRVLVKSFLRGTEKWVQGRIVDATGPATYEVSLRDGRIVTRHADHIREFTAESESDSEVSQLGSVSSDEYSED